MAATARPSAPAIASRLAVVPASLGIAGMMKLERPWSLPSATTRHCTGPIFSSSTTSLPAPRRNVSTSAVPTVGWPANGISLPGVKMRAPAVLPAAFGDQFVVLIIGAVMKLDDAGAGTGFRFAFADDFGGAVHGVAFEQRMG